jgi:hypothetical protein
VTKENEIEKLQDEIEDQHGRTLASLVEGLESAGISVNFETEKKLSQAIENMVRLASLHIELEVAKALKSSGL